MSKGIIGRRSVSVERIREELGRGSVNSIREALPDAAILSACRETGYEYRRRLLGPVVVVLHMTLAALWPEDSLGASWQVLWASLRSRLPEAGRGPASSSLARARARLPLAMWRRLFEWASSRVAAQSEAWAKWRGHRVVLVDGTCVSMPDEPELREAFGSCRSKGKAGRYPLARMVALTLANTMTVIDYALGRYDDSEAALMRPLLKSLNPGDLIMGDRHFAAAHYYVRYREHGFEFLMRKHQKRKVSTLKALWRHGPGDFVTAMRVTPAYRLQDPSLPRDITVRMIQIVARVRGRRQTMWLVTSLLDAKRYPAGEIAQLYARRWRIETLFRQVKVGLSADVLRSKRPDGVRKEVAARLIALNVVRSLILDAADAHNIDPHRISFVQALRTTLAFAPVMAIAPPERLPLLYRTMLHEISLHLVPHRPGRNEPRMIRREKKHYSDLRMTRQQWRDAHAA